MSVSVGLRHRQRQGGVSSRQVPATLGVTSAAWRRAHRLSVYPVAARGNYWFARPHCYRHGSWCHPTGRTGHPVVCGQMRVLSCTVSIRSRARGCSGQREVTWGQRRAITPLQDGARALGIGPPIPRTSAPCPARRTLCLTSRSRRSSLDHGAATGIRLRLAGCTQVKWVYLE